MAEILEKKQVFQVHALKFIFDCGDGLLFKGRLVISQKLVTHTACGDTVTFPFSQKPSQLPFVKQGWKFQSLVTSYVRGFEFSVVKFCPETERPKHFEIKDGKLPKILALTVTLNPNPSLRTLVYFSNNLGYTFHLLMNFI